MDRLYRTTRTVAYDPAGNVYTDTEYDDKGRVYRTSAPYRSGGSPDWTTTAYDALDRPITITHPDDTTIQYSYSANVTTETDEDSKQRRYTTNGLDQLAGVEEPNPTLSTALTTFYSYYVFGPLAKVTQSSQTRTFVYDWLGFMTSETHPESGTTSYTPVSNSVLVYQRTDARSVTATYTYDDIDRLRTTVYSDGTPEVVRTYDDSGKEGLLSSVQDGLGTTTFSYSDAGLVLSESRGFDEKFGDGEQLAFWFRRRNRSANGMALRKTVDTSRDIDFDLYNGGFIHPWQSSTLETRDKFRGQ
jgi:YD repeat-containing protein